MNESQHELNCPTRVLTTNASTFVFDKCALEQSHSSFRGAVFRYGVATVSRIDKSIGLFAEYCLFYGALLQNVVFEKCTLEQSHSSFRGARLLTNSKITDILRY